MDEESNSGSGDELHDDDLDNNNAVAVEEVGNAANFVASRKEGRRQRLEQLAMDNDIRRVQKFYITLQNQLLPAQGGGSLLMDPNGFIYRFEKRYKTTDYHKCCNGNCHGRCKVVANDTQLIVTAAHNDDCEPDVSEREMRHFKKALLERSKNDIITPFSAIYNALAPFYPGAALILRAEDFKKQMYEARRKVTTKRLPNSLKELGTWMEDIDYRRRFAFDSGTPPALFFEGIHETSDGRSYAAFRSETVVNAATGGIITIEMDGTFSIVPNRLKSTTEKFDNCYQLLMVHYRRRNRNYPIGYFLLSSALTDILATDILQRVTSWLGPTTSVERIITDYETALRNASHKVHPKAKVVGCDVHYARAIGEWAYNAGAYRSATQADLTAVRRAFALCYLPEGYIAMGIDVIEADVWDTAFGKRFIKYLRSTWLRENISVFNERTRTTNGSESFHWRVQRVHDRMHNNINQFLEQLRKIEAMCATSVKQFHKCILSKKQQRVEKMHEDLARTFDLECGRMPDGNIIRRFLDSTLHFAGNIHKHFVKRAMNKAKRASGHSLLIADKYIEIAGGNENSRKKTDLSVTLTLNPHDSIHKQRTLTLRPDKENVVRKAHGKVKCHPNNVVIADKSISILHASIYLTKDGIIEIRDDGSEAGTFINDRRLGYSGTTSPCFNLSNGDVVCFGTVKFTVQIASLAPQISLPDTAPLRSSQITLRRIAGDILPERNLRLVENAPTIIGKATQRKPALRTNGHFILPQIAPIHAHIVWTGNAYLIKSVSPTYRTWVDGQILKQNQQVQIHHNQELIFGSNEVNDNVQVLFIVDALPVTSSWRDIELSFLLQNDGQGNLAHFTMKDNDRLEIGRRPNNYQCQPNELFFTNEIVSRHHALIVYENGILNICDTNSENGTYVNSNLVIANEYVRLKNGATIQLGATPDNEASPVLMKLLFKKLQEPQPEPHTARHVELKLPDAFIIITPNSKVLLSSFHQGIIIDCQRDEYLDKQWLAMAVAALIRKTISPMENWSATIVDDIIYNGDDLYAEIVENMKRDGRQPPPNGSLQITELRYVQDSLSMFSNEYRISFQDEPIVDGNLYRGSPDHLPLKEGLADFFANHQTGLLSVYHQVFAIICQNKKFYIFQPSSNHYSKSNAAVFQSDNILEFYSIVRKIVGSENDWYVIQCIEAFEKTACTSIGDYEFSSSESESEPDNESDSPSVQRPATISIGDYEFSSSESESEPDNESDSPSVQRPATISIGDYEFSSSEFEFESDNESDSPSVQRPATISIGDYKFSSSESESEPEDDLYTNPKPGPSRPYQSPPRHPFQRSYYSDDDDSD